MLLHLCWPVRWRNNLHRRKVSSYSDNRQALWTLPNGVFWLQKTRYPLLQLLFWFHNEHPEILDNNFRKSFRIWLPFSFLRINQIYWLSTTTAAKIWNIALECWILFGDFVVETFQKLASRVMLFQKICAFWTRFRANVPHHLKTTSKLWKIFHKYWLILQCVVAKKVQISASRNTFLWPKKLGPEFFEKRDRHSP